MNVEVGQESIEELESAFRFNDAVIRNLIIRRDAAKLAILSSMKRSCVDERIGNAIAGDKKESASRAPAAEPASEAPAEEAPEADTV